MGWQEWIRILESNVMDAEMESWQVDIYNDVQLGQAHKSDMTVPRALLHYYALLLRFMTHIYI